MTATDFEVIHEGRKLKKLSVEILWGSDREADQEPTLYQFDTQAEIRAFNEGVHEGVGWLDYEILYNDEE